MCLSRFEEIQRKESKAIRTHLSTIFFAGTEIQEFAPRVISRDVFKFEVGSYMVYSLGVSLNTIPTLSMVFLHSKQERKEKA